MGVKYYNVALEVSLDRRGSTDGLGGLGDGEGKRGQVPFWLAERVIVAGSLSAHYEVTAGESSVIDPHGRISDDRAHWG